MEGKSPKCGKGRLLLLLAAVVAIAVAASAANAAMVDVDVVGDSRGQVPVYSIVPRGHYATFRAYVEAVKGERYSIRVTNNTGRRVGVVIAVDGRNIIDGKKSYLRNSERMYILDPYVSRTYEGWRTDHDKVNRFYFTDPGDSYSGAFGDYSAMGVIAVAAFREKYVPPPQPRIEERGRDGRWIEPEGRPSAPGASRDLGAASKAAPRAKEERAGTGYGETAYSPTVTVEFHPETRVAERHILKYEWRETLCKKGIIDCRWPKNRFWDDDDDEFAPPPPDRRRDRD